MRTSHTKIIRLLNAEQMHAAATNSIIQASKTAIVDHGRFFIALAGGNTPRGLYQSLALPEIRGQLDWSRFDFFWGDERAVPPDHADSNFRMANECLLEPLAIASERIHRIEAENPDLDQAADLYQQKIALICGVKPDDPPPRLDLVLLGMGADGHTASLFPHTTALRETSRWVVANHVPQLSTTRITMTAPLINRCRQVIFLVSGRDKASRLSQVLDGPHDPDRLPSQLIRPSPGSLTWLVDKYAAAELDLSTEQDR